MIRLFKNNVMRINLRLCPAEQLHATNADLSLISRLIRIRLQERGNVLGKFTERYSLAIYATTEMARQLGLPRRFVNIA